MSVDRVRVGDVLALQRRSVDVDPLAEYIEIGVRSFGKGVFHKEPITGADLGAKRVFRIEPGDLVISNVFAWEGAVALATQAERGTIGSHRFMTFTPTSDAIDSAWASWFFRSEPGLERIRKAPPGSAGRNRTLAIERFENLIIPLPPIEEQRRIAAHLDVTRARSDRLSGIFDDHPSDGLVRRLPDLTDAVLDLHAHDRARVGELADFVSDTVHPGDDPSPADRFIGLQHVASHTGLRVGSDALGPMKGRKFRFRPGDVLYGYLRPYLNKVWVADCDGLCSVDQYVLRPHPGVNSDVLGHALRGRRVLTAAVDLTHSLQLPRLRSGLLAALEVPTVEPFVAERVATRLSTVRDLMVDMARARTHQRELVSALLPSAMNQAFADLT